MLDFLIWCFWEFDVFDVCKLHLFDFKYNKNCNIVKYYYNLIYIYIFEHNNCQIFDGKAELFSGL